MATISREAALAMIAQVERQAGVIARRYTGNEVILDRFADFRGFIDALSEFHLFIDMVENRLGAFGPGDRATQTRKLATIRAGILALELETTSLFLDRMVTHDRPWPMGSQKFLRRRLTRLDDIAGFHAAQGADYQLTPPDAAQMQNIRDRVAGQIDNSVPLADFGATAPPPAMPEEQMPEEQMPEEPETIIEPPPPEAPQAPAPVIQAIEPPKPADPKPAAPPPAPTQPDVMIPGMMGFGAPVSYAPISEPATSKAPKPLAAAPVLPELMIPGMIMPAPPVSAPPEPEPPPPVAPAPPPPTPTPPVPPTAPEVMDFDADYVSKKAQAVAKLAANAASKPEAKTGTPGLARRDFRLKVRSEADGYQYIDGNGLAVMTESCRVANTTIDELAKTLELSRPGLVLILNGRDPVSSELLKTLRRFVRRTGGLA